MTIDPADSRDEGVALTDRLGGRLQPVAVFLGIDEPQRVQWRQLAVELLEASFVQERFQPRSRRPWHVVAARGADIETFFELLAINDFVAFLALAPQPLHA